MRTMAFLSMALLLTAGACKKKDGGSNVAEDTFNAATNVANEAANLVATAAGATNCPPPPECPAAPACPTCPECVDPTALGKTEVGGEATTVKTPAPAGLTFTVEKAGEYQIDAAATENDPAVMLYKDDERIGRDDDGGGDRNARLFAFLAPGTYTARVTEIDWQPVEAKVRVQAAAPITPAGTVKVGESLDVPVVEGPNDRESSGEVTVDPNSG